MDFNESPLRDLPVPAHRPITFTIKLVVFLAGLTLPLFAISSLDGWAVVPFQILIALAMAYGVELQHQALHSRGGKILKGFSPIGFILGLPMLVSFTYYKDSHLHHHRAVGTEDDKEFFDYGKKDLASLRSLLVMIFMLPHYSTFAKRLMLSVQGKALGLHNSRRESIARTEFILIALVVAAVAAYSVYAQTITFILGWLIPLILFAGPIHTLVEIPEHYRCESRSLDSMRNTRTVVSNGLMYRFTNGNNFHVEHHYCPAWPMDKLHLLHQKIFHKIVYTSVGYREFYLMFFRDVIDAALDKIRADKEKAGAAT